MITTEQYFGHKLHTDAQTVAAQYLLGKRNSLRVEWMQDTDKSCPIDPDTGTEISGSRGGNGDGGFRLTTATTGRSNSSHKCLPADNPEGAGVDDYDPLNEFDTWLDGFEARDGSGNRKLEEYDLYREAPESTDTWVHLTTRPPPSGKRTFMP